MSEDGLSGELDEAVANTEWWTGLLWLSTAFVTGAVAIGFQLSGQWTPLGAPGWLAVVVTLLALGLSLADPFIRLGVGRRTALAAVGIAGWSVLVFIDDGWTIFNFSVYAACFSAGRRRGVVLAAIASIVWAAAWLADDESMWLILIPAVVFLISSSLSLAIWRFGELNERQSRLIGELERSQVALAESEHNRGVIAERQRLASEIHDTLAQGFTSIVLLSRVGQRSADGGLAALASIESTALDNLENARRLVGALGPSELESGSLADALHNQLDALPPGIDGELHVVGDVRALGGAIEVVALRAVQEAVTNATTHGDPSRIDVTMSFMGDLLAIDVRDDGCGFDPGTVADRGELTGGQGLGLMHDRAESVGGRVEVESASEAGTVVSIQLPVDGAPS